MEVLKKIKEKYLEKVMKRALRLWVKKRRCKRGARLKEIKSDGRVEAAVRKIQALARGYIVRRVVMRRLRALCMFKYEQLRVNALFFETPAFMSILSNYNAKET